MMPLPNDAVSIEEITQVDQIAIPEVTGARGPQGWAAEFQVSATHVQWRTTNPLATDWTDLVALADLEGPEGPVGPAPELQVAGGWIQWREPEGVWQNLVEISTLVGPQGLSAYQVAQDNGFPGTEAEWLASLVGQDGDPGDAATIVVGSVTTVANGQPATVTNSGTPDAAVLDFEIPVGGQGLPGLPGSNGTGWTGASYNPADGTITFTSTDGLGFTTGDLRGADGVDGSDGLGWTGASYDAGTGQVTFTSDDGLGFVTGDLRGADGIGVPDPSAIADGQMIYVSGGALVYGDPPAGGGGSGVDLVGEWQAGTSYTAGQGVTVGNEWFLALADNIDADPTDTGAVAELSRTTGTAGSSSLYGYYTFGSRFTVPEAITVQALGCRILSAGGAQLDRVAIAVYQAGVAWPNLANVLADKTAAAPVSAQDYSPVAFDSAVVLTPGTEYVALFHLTDQPGAYTQLITNTTWGSVDGVFTPVGRSQAPTTIGGTPSASTDAIYPFALYEPTAPWKHGGGLPAVTNLTSPDNSSVPTGQAVVDYVGGLTVDPTADIFMMMGA